MRHVPELISVDAELGAPKLPFEDELRFIYYRFGRKWVTWSLFRAILTGYTSPLEALNSTSNYLAIRKELQL